MMKSTEQQGPWQLDSYLDLAFDGLTGSEYWTSAACARNIETDERLTLDELIPYLNELERRIRPAKSAADARTQHIRQVLYAAGIDWNKTTARLARCSWITEAYIRQHIQAVPPEHLGLAIRRMLDGLPPPPCRCGRCEHCQRRSLAQFPQIQR
jgi:hypothetical protein